MPLIATLTQRTTNPIPGQPVIYSLALFNNQATSVTATAVQPFIQVPASVNTSLISTTAVGQIIAQGTALTAAMFPITVPANSTITVPFGVFFQAPLTGPAYQLSCQVTASDGTGAVPPAVAITPSTIGPTVTNIPATFLSTIAPLGMLDLSSPTTTARTLGFA